MVFSNSYYAIANTTTDSFLLFDSRAAAVSGSLSVQTGSYNMKTDTYNWGSASNYTFSDGALSSSGGFVNYNTSFSPTNGYAVRFTFSDFGSFNDIRSILGRLNFSIYVGDERYISRSTLKNFVSFYTANWSGTLVNGYTHFGSSASSSGSVPGSSLSLYGELGVDYQYLLDCVLPLEVPSVELWENYVESSNGNRVYNTYVDDFTLTFVFNLTNGFMSNSGVGFLNSGVSAGDSVRFATYVGDNICSIIASSFGDSTGISSVGTSIQNSISNMQSSLSNSITNVQNNISQVKTQITQSTNTISTKIDTMSNDITSGLSNVVDSISNGVADIVQGTKNIQGTIINKVNEVKTSISEVKDTITDLPNKLEEKALSLVVPEQEVLESKFSEIEDLLRGRFGLIYQAEEVIVDFANSLQTSTATSEATGGKIIFPPVVVNLPDETAFNFGGYEVDLIPDGFEILVNAVRLAVNMVCTAIFINMCKNKLEVIFK